MRRWVLVVVVAAATLPACKKGIETFSPRPPERPPSDNGQSSHDQMVSRELQLFLYDKKVSDDKPRFEITAQKAVLSQDDTWKIEGAIATIHSAKKEDIHLDAAEASLDQRKDKESAYLKNGVTMQTGSSTFKMKSLRWLNRDGVIRSGDPVTITRPDMTMDAAGLVYYPDDDRLELTKVNGVINLEKAEKP